MCGAFTTRSPVGVKIAQLKSSRSLTLVEKDVICKVTPICSAIAAKRLLKISSVTGSMSSALRRRILLRLLPGDAASAALSEITISPRP